MADLGRVKSKSPEKKTSLFSCPPSVSCSVCLEFVTDAGERSIAKLKCGHHFHLDCIGSAFNAKGVMQCPNCRCIEEGQWLYANGCHHFEDYAVDGLPYEDDYEVYAGIVDLFQPHDDLQLNNLHWSAYPSSSHQHVSVTLEETDSPASGYPDIVVNVLYDELGGSSNPAHACPFLTSQMVHYPRQMQFLDGNSRIPHNQEVTPPTLAASRIGGSARTQRISGSDRNSWSSHAMGPLLSTNSALNADYAEPPISTHERMRRSRAVSGHSAHGNYAPTFSQARLHRRMPGSNASSSEAPSMTAYGHNQRPGESLNSTQHAPSSALHHRLNGTSRRARFRGSPAVFLGGSSSDIVHERGLGASWNMGSRIGGDYAGGISSLDDVGWTDESQGYFWQRNSHHANRQRNAAFGNRQRNAHFENRWDAYDPESLWQPWFHNDVISPPYDDMATIGYHENDFYGVDGQVQAELIIPPEEHLSAHGHGVW